MNQPHVHVSGCGGVGMNAVAQLCLAAGWRVSGSDRFYDQGRMLPVLKQLQDKGLELKPQDGSALEADSKALIISTAVEADNPERLRAAELGVEEWHRSKALAHFAVSDQLLGIAGTSGKTTCCGMLGWVLAEGGLNPWVVNGGGVLGWKNKQEPGNVRLGGEGAPWVLELDESDKSLLRFHPARAMISSITEDHFPMEETLQLFRDFAASVRHSIICGPGVKEQLAGDARITAQLIAVEEGLDSPLPGEHNRMNAATVAALARDCGMQEEAILRALARFPGIERRLEYHGGKVWDDYAHNPEKIAAVLKAMKTAEDPLIALWRPHGFAALQQNFAAFVDCFCEGLAEGDEAWILPVFYAGGTAPREGLGSAELVHALQQRGCRARLIEDYPQELSLPAETRLLVMGARDPELPRFAARAGSARGGLS